VGLRRVPAKVNFNLNNRTGTWSDPNSISGNWSASNPVVSRLLQVIFDRTVMVVITINVIF